MQTEKPGHVVSLHVNSTDNAHSNASIVSTNRAAHDGDLRAREWEKVVQLLSRSSVGWCRSQCLSRLIMLIFT